MHRGFTSRPTVQAYRTLHSGHHSYAASRYPCHTLQPAAAAACLCHWHWQHIWCQHSDIPFVEKISCLQPAADSPDNARPIRPAMLSRFNSSANWADCDWPSVNRLMLLRRLNVHTHSICHSIWRFTHDCLTRWRFARTVKKNKTHSRWISILHLKATLTARQGYREPTQTSKAM